MTRVDVFSLVGFLLFIMGATSLALSLVGLRWSWLAWLDGIGPVFGFVVKIMMVELGIALVAYVRMDDGHEDES